jgi:hypothetical protein
VQLDLPVLEQPVHGVQQEQQEQQEQLVQREQREQLVQPDLQDLGQRVQWDQPVWLEQQEQPA